MTNPALGAPAIPVSPRRGLVARPELFCAGTHSVNVD